MAQPEVLAYLEAHSFDQLTAEHGVKVRAANDYTLFSLNYHMIEARSGVRLVEECRGLVVRPRIQRDPLLWKGTIVGPCDVVAHGMNRFYNHGEGFAAQLDSGSTRVYEKLDGTMILLYWNEQRSQWSCATRAVPEADLPIDSTGLTFSGLFWRALRDTLNASLTPTGWTMDEWLATLDKGQTYVFELMTPINQVVVEYHDNRVALLARRDIASGEELPIAKDLLAGIDTPPTWELSHDISKLIETVDAADPKVLEGAVLCDGAFRRVKVKNRSYVLASRMKDSLETSPRNMVEVILRGKADDVLPLLDKRTAAQMLDLQEKVRAFVTGSDNLFRRLKQEGQTRKEFALAMQASGQPYLSYVMFGLLDGKVGTTGEYFALAAESGKLTPSMIDQVIAQI